MTERPAVPLIVWHTIRASAVAAVRAISHVFSDIESEYLFDGRTFPRPWTLKVYDLLHARPRRDVYPDVSFDGAITAAKVQLHQRTAVQEIEVGSLATMFPPLKTM
jgi:hypothetical protein